MSNRKPVSCIVFDVNETLLDITTLEPLFERLFGDGSVMREWFAELILYSQTMTLSGRYAPFGALAEGVLRMVADNKDVQLADRDVDELKSRIGAMPAYADVKPALARLREAGFTLATLTNSAPAPAPTPMEKAGIAACFDHHFSVAEVGKFKPHPDTYAMVQDRLSIAPAQLCMVACHLWDTIGAQAAGWQGAFVRRPNNSVLHVPDAPLPDITADDLGTLADRIIAANSAG